VQPVQDSGLGDHPSVGRAYPRCREEQVAITALRAMTPAHVRAAVDGFAASYVRDWDAWLATSPGQRPIALGRTLRRWQATRPYPMRRPRGEGGHPPPYLEDLVAAAEEPLAAIGAMTVMSVHERSLHQDRAFANLWSVFSGLTTRGTASSVGISKAMLLLTDGRIGPALDSRVRANIGAAPPSDHREWLLILEAIADDVRAFEHEYGQLRSAESPRFASLGSGRLFDMRVGPR
jgi:hypothetical protein